MQFIHWSLQPTYHITEYILEVSKIHDNTALMQDRIRNSQCNEERLVHLRRSRCSFDLSILSLVGHLSGETNYIYLKLRSLVVGVHKRHLFFVTHTHTQCFFTQCYVNNFSD